MHIVGSCQKILHRSLLNLSYFLHYTSQNSNSLLKLLYFAHHSPSCRKQYCYQTSFYCNNRPGKDRICILLYFLFVSIFPILLFLFYPKNGQRKFKGLKCSKFPALHKILQMNSYHFMKRSINGFNLLFNKDQRDASQSINTKN